VTGTSVTFAIGTVPNKCDGADTIDNDNDDEQFRTGINDADVGEQNG